MEGLCFHNLPRLQLSMLNRGIYNKMDKVSVFVDGGYLNRVLKNYFNKPDIDYIKFCDNLCAILNAKRLRTYYYNCMPIRRKGNESDEKRYAGVQKFFTSLKRLPRFEVKLGELQLIGGIFKQKMIDVLMSLDIVDICFNKQVEHVAVIAGDADFVPAIKKAKEHGVIAHLFYHRSSVHNELMDVVDELHEISEDLINKSKK